MKEDFVAAATDVFLDLLEFHLSKVLDGFGPLYYTESVEVDYSRGLEKKCLSSLKQEGRGRGRGQGRGAEGGETYPAAA